MLHVWHIYLQNWSFFRANVGKYSSTMEHMGYYISWYYKKMLPNHGALRSSIPHALGSLGGCLHFVTVVAAGNLGIQFHPHAVLAPRKGPWVPVTGVLHIIRTLLTIYANVRNHVHVYSQCQPSSWFWKPELSIAIYS